MKIDRSPSQTFEEFWDSGYINGYIDQLYGVQSLPYEASALKMIQQDNSFDAFSSYTDRFYEFAQRVYLEYCRREEHFEDDACHYIASNEGYAEITVPDGKQPIQQNIYCEVVPTNVTRNANRLYYRTYDETIRVGDIVVCPMTEKNYGVTEKVISVKYYDDSDVPFSLEKTKEIRGKYDETWKSEIDVLRSTFKLDLPNNILIIAEYENWGHKPFGTYITYHQNLQSCFKIMPESCFTYYTDLKGDLKCKAIHKHGINRYTYRLITASEEDIKTLCDLIDNETARGLSLNDMYAAIARTTKSLGGYFANVSNYAGPPVTVSDDRFPLAV